MHCMVASSIPCKLSLCADRAHARAGDSHASSAIDVACPTTQKVLAIASPHELHGDSWPSSSTGTRSFCCNQQFSITAITNSTGAISERYAYSAYGQPTILDASGSSLSPQVSSLNNRYTYTGREWDATLALHHFRARWMSPIAGRFIARDPIGFIDGLNSYRNYFLLSKMDPSGTRCCVHLWLPRTFSEVGHAALKCNSGYYSFWPKTGAGLFNPTDACSANTEPEDEAIEGRAPDRITCIDCPLDEQAIAAKWREIQQECRNGNRNFCLYGGNCSSTVYSLLRSGLPACSSKCPRCQEFAGCNDRCAGYISGGPPGFDKPSGVEIYAICLRNNDCKSLEPYCVKGPDNRIGSKW